MGLRIVDYVSFEVKRLSGPPLPAALLFPIISEVLGSDWIVWAERCWQQHMTHPWRVERRTKTSGAMNYVLRVLEDRDWCHAPVRAVIHVSPYGRLNHEIKVPIRFLLPLLTAVIQDNPPPEPNAYEFWVSELRWSDDFNEPGSGSGLRETLESLRVMHRLTESNPNG